MKDFCMTLDNQLTFFFFFLGDIEEMEQHKDEIVKNQLLKLGFLNAKLGPEGHPWET